MDAEEIFKELLKVGNQTALCEEDKQNGKEIAESLLLNYLELYYCYDNRALFFIVSLILMISLFYGMCRYCDVHFTTALSAISNYLKLRPEVAGVTFLGKCRYRD